MKKIKVLSLFDGMACTRIALDKLGYKNVEYYASEIDQYGMKVAKDNYPDIIHIGDISKIDNKFIKSLGEVDLMIGGSPCFPAGTMVFTKNSGYKPIDKLLIGEEVLTHKGRFRKILDWGYKTSQQFVKLKGFDKETISTLNHPYYVKIKNKDGILSEPYWEAANNLTTYHYIAQFDLENISEETIKWENIQEIKKLEREKTLVYNIEVEEDNSYTANSIIVHNCQGFSKSGKGLNFEDPRSKLFFEYVRILNKLKPKNFILENVHMKQEWQDVISKYLKVQPILLNSNLVSAQNRPRLYWTNIPDITPPKDKQIFFQDIMEKKPAANYYYSDAALAWIKRHGERKNKKIRELNQKNVKMQCLEASMFKNYSSQRFFQITDKKGPRYITVVECERCQTVPDNYTKAVSNTQRYKMLGNGFTVDMIAHLLKNMRL
jgi:site-specific DNA-cytosine methylase